MARKNAADPNNTIPFGCKLDVETKAKLDFILQATGSTSAGFFRTAVNLMTPIALHQQSLVNKARNAIRIMAEASEVEFDPAKVTGKIPQLNTTPVNLSKTEATVTPTETTPVPLTKEPEATTGSLDDILGIPPGTYDEQGQLAKKTVPDSKDIVDLADFLESN